MGKKKLNFRPRGHEVYDVKPGTYLSKFATDGRITAKRINFRGTPFEIFRRALASGDLVEVDQAAKVIPVETIPVSPRVPKQESAAEIVPIERRRPGKPVGSKTKSKTKENGEHEK